MLINHNWWSSIFSIVSNNIGISLSSHVDEVECEAEHGHEDSLNEQEVPNVDYGCGYHSHIMGSGLKESHPVKGIKPEEEHGSCAQDAL